ncbi:MAG: hypothetical protein ABGY29_10270, partial [bacterium]
MAVDDKGKGKGKGKEAEYKEFLQWVSSNGGPKKAMEVMGAKGKSNGKGQSQEYGEAAPGLVVKSRAGPEAEGRPAKMARTEGKGHQGNGQGKGQSKGVQQEHPRPEAASPPIKRARSAEFRVIEVPDDSQPRGVGAVGAAADRPRLDATEQGGDAAREPEVDEGSVDPFAAALRTPRSTEATQDSLPFLKELDELENGFDGEELDELEDGFDPREQPPQASQLILEQPPQASPQDAQLEQQTQDPIPEAAAAAAVKPGRGMYSRERALPKW